MQAAFGKNSPSMKISVITVTYNALDMLLETAESVASQDYDDFEYIIVDGASSDGTPDILRKGIKGVSRWISEPDHGIYEAMNKGARMASGDYCIFMNAGDRLINGNVLSKVAVFLDGSDFITGNEIVWDGKDIIFCYRASGSYTLQNLLQSSARHQSTFIKRSILIGKPYDESLRLVSDWKLTLECFIDGGCSFKTVDIDICLFADGGATEKFHETGQLEKLSVLSKYPEYKMIWSKPYKPGFFLKVKNKLYFYYKKWEYRNLNK